MSELKDLDDVVRDAIKAGQVGRPVFVRCVIGVPESADEQANVVVDCLMSIRLWFGDSISRLYAMGSWGSGPSLHVQFRGGGMALVTARVSRPWSADLIVLGNHGAMYHDGFSGGFAVLSRSFAESDTKRSVRTAVQAAVKSGQPQDVADTVP
jgi:hypothetical protein